MKRIRYILLIMLFPSCYSFSQNKIRYSDEFQFIGYLFDRPIFHLFDDSDYRNLYTLSKDSTGLNAFILESKAEIKGVPVFVYNDILVSHKYDELHKIRWVYVSQLGGQTLDSISISREFRVSYSKKNHTLYLTVGNRHFSKLSYIDIKSDAPKIIKTPIFANEIIVEDEFILVSYDRVNFDYSPYLADIFLLHNKDFQNPELIIKGIETNEWFLFPNKDVIYIHVDLGKEKENYDLIYSLKSKLFSEIENIGFTTILKVDSGYFFLKQTKARVYPTYNLIPVPTPSLNLSLTDKRVILPREIWYNVPLREKTFPNTFITPYLLREAPKPELETLDKTQLRLLRNAIYAQQAYIFQSHDLKDFFNQFEWYRMMTNRKTSNDDVVLLAEDEARAELIREIEESK